MSDGGDWIVWAAIIIFACIVAFGALSLGGWVVVK
jgi:hypothetical protein